MAMESARPEPVPVAVVLRGLLQTTRPKQWIKNGFVFAPVLFSGLLLERAAFSTALLATVLFCALSGAIYLINDLVDRERDRQHPKKRLRPLAAGIVSPRQAAVAAVLLGPGALMGAFVLGTGFGAVASAYFLLMLAYSFTLKHIVLVDVLTIALGFVLRVLAGAAALQVPVSVWIIICTLALSLVLGFNKRRHEKVSAAGGGREHRPILDEYNQLFLDQLIGISVTMTIITYSLWAVEGPQGPLMLATIPFVVYGVFRYLYLVYKQGLGGSPEEILLTDWPFMLNLVLWGLAAVVFIYVLPQPDGLILH